MKLHLIGKGGAPGYPYDVALNLDATDRKFVCLGEGSGFAASGGSFELADLLKPVWDQHLETTGTLWMRELAESERDGLRDWDVETVRLVADQRNATAETRQKRAMLLVSVASEFMQAERPHAAAILFVEAATHQPVGVRWDVLASLLERSGLQCEPPSVTSLSRIRDAVWADRALETALDVKPALAMGTLMSLEGILRNGPLRVVCDAIRGRWDDGSARSALKRLGTFGDSPLIRETLEYRFGNDPEPLRPYLDFAAQAIDKTWALSIGSEPFDV